MCMLSCFSHIHLLVTPWTVAHQAPLSMGFSGQEYWSGLPCPPSGDLPDPGIELVSHVSCIGRQVLYYSHHLGSPNYHQVLSTLLPISAISTTLVQATLTFSTALTTCSSYLGSLHPPLHPVQSTWCPINIPVNQNHTTELTALYPEPFGGSHMIWTCSKTLPGKKSYSLKENKV